MQVNLTYSNFNDRRYSKPWGAIVTFSGGKPQYNFRVGTYLGDSNGGEVVIDCQPGDIIASGQKDNRGGNTGNTWYIVSQDGEVAKCTKAEALAHWNAKKVGGTE